MAYRIASGEAMADAIRRIVGEQLDDAIAQLEGRGERDGDEAVHEARKDLKKARSALRLARYDLGGRVRSAENAVLRDAGRRLSGLRDAQVLLETLSVVADDPSLERARDGVAALREALEHRRSQLDREVGSPRAAEGDGAARDLIAVRRRVEDWPLTDPGFDAAGRGLRRLQADGRDAMRRALEDGSDDEAWHEWRKRVKDLWYSLRLLEPVAPRLLRGMVEEADALSDILGDHNDLAVLSAAMQEHADVLTPEDGALLRAAVHRRQEELRRQARPLGLRLYAERPKAFARRLERYWTVRQHDAQPPP